MDTQRTPIPFSLRLRREQSWADALRSLGPRVSGDTRDEVARMHSFLFSNLAPAEPIAVDDREEYGVRLHGPQTMGFVALFHADKQLHPSYASRVRNMKYSYIEDVRSVIVAPQAISPTWRGLVLFHEVHHALFHEEKAYRDIPLASWTEEQAIYKNEHQAVAELYGRPYKEFITRAAAAAAHEADNGTIMRRKLARIANPAFESFYSDATTENEQVVRRGPLMNHIGYTALALKGLSAETDRARFQRSLETGGQELWFGTDVPIGT